jgi:hypothetical protein
MTFALIFIPSKTNNSFLLGNNDCYCLYFFVCTFCLNYSKGGPRHKVYLFKRYIWREGHDTKFVSFQKWKEESSKQKNITNYCSSLYFFVYRILFFGTALVSIPFLVYQPGIPSLPLFEGIQEKG